MFSIILTALSATMLLRGTSMIECSFTQCVWKHFIDFWQPNLAIAECNSLKAFSVKCWLENHADAHAVDIKLQILLSWSRCSGRRKYASRANVALEFHLALWSDGSFRHLIFGNLPLFLYALYASQSSNRNLKSLLHPAFSQLGTSSPTVYFVWRFLYGSHTDCKSYQQSRS